MFNTFLTEFGTIIEVSVNGATHSLAVKRLFVVLFMFSAVVSMFAGFITTIVGGYFMPITMVLAPAIVGYIYSNLVDIINPHLMAYLQARH